MGLATRESGYPVPTMDATATKTQADTSAPKDQYGRPMSQYALDNNQCIRRSGLVQAAGPVAGAYSSNIEDAANNAIKIAEIWLKWVEAERRDR